MDAGVWVGTLKLLVTHVARISLTNVESSHPMIIVT